MKPRKKAAKICSAVYRSIYLQLKLVVGYACRQSSKRPLMGGGGSYCETRRCGVVHCKSFMKNTNTHVMYVCMYRGWHGRLAGSIVLINREGIKAEGDLERELLHWHGIPNTTRHGKHHGGGISAKAYYYYS